MHYSSFGQVAREASNRAEVLLAEQLAHVKKAMETARTVNTIHHTRTRTHTHIYNNHTTALFVPRLLVKRPIAPKYS